MGAVIVLCGAAEMPEIVKLSTKLRQTDSITVNWTVNGSESDVDRYQVTVTDMDESFTIIFEGEEFVKRGVNESTAQVIVHEMSTTYNICVAAMLTQDAADTFNVTSVEQCLEASSIGAMRTSSIVALLLVLLFFVLCIVAGYITWRCASRSTEEDEYEKTEMNGNGEVVPLTQIES